MIKIINPFQRTLNTLENLIPATHYTSKFKSAKSNADFTSALSRILQSQLRRAQKKQKNSKSKPPRHGNEPRSTEAARMNEDNSRRIYGGAALAPGRLLNPAAGDKFRASPSLYRAAGFCACHGAHCVCVCVCSRAQNHGDVIKRRAGGLIAGREFSINRLLNFRKTPGASRKF